MTVERTPYFIVFLLWCAGVLAAGQFAKVSVTFPYFREAYPGQGAALGFLVSALSLVGIFLGLLTGVILARYGYRRLLLAALVIGGALSLVQAAGLPFGVMLATRGLEGLSHLVIVVAAPTMIGQMAVPRHRAIAMTFWSTIFALSFALFSWLGLPFVGRFGVGALFVVHGLLLLLIAALIARRLPRVQRPPAGPLTLHAVIERHARAYLSPEIVAPALGWIFYTLTFVALVTVLPDFLDPAWRAALSGLLPISALVVSMTLGIVMLRRMDPIRVVLVGFAGSALVALATLPQVGLAALAVVMLGGMGLVQSGSFSAIPALNADPDDQALANGALAQAGNLGNTIGTPLLLWLTGGFGYAGLVAFTVIAYLCAIIAHVWLRALRRRRGGLC